MKDLELSANVQTMSSLEIAELTGKRHDNIVNDIVRILNEAGIGVLQFEGSYLSSQNKELLCYNLPKRECDLVISGYSVKYRLAIIDRWHELEANKKPMTRLELAKMQVALIMELEDSKENVKRLEIEIDESMDWCSIKRMEFLTGKNYNWRELKSSSIKLNIPRKDIFDANYGSVKSYHKDLWMDAYELDLSILTGK